LAETCSFFYAIKYQHKTYYHSCVSWLKFTSPLDCNSSSELWYLHRQGRSVDGDESHNFHSLPPPPPKAQQPPSGSGPSHYRGFTITLRHTTLGRTPLDEWSARPRGIPDNTQEKKHPCPRRDSNTIQQASGRGPTRPLRSTKSQYTWMLYITTILRRAAHAFSMNVATNSNFKAREGWHEARFILRMWPVNFIWRFPLCLWNDSCVYGGKLQKLCLNIRRHQTAFVLFLWISVFLNHFHVV